MNRSETMVLGSRIGTAGRIAPGQERGVVSLSLPSPGPPPGDGDAMSGAARAYRATQGGEPNGSPRKLG